MARKNIESAIQKELVRWMAREYPAVEILYVKNEGKKNIIEAQNDKRMGLAVGWPDLTLFKIYDNTTHILHLELKTKIGKLSASQKEWHSKFKQTKNRIAKVAYGFEEAQNVIRAWLSSLPKNN